MGKSIFAKYLLFFLAGHVTCFATLPILTKEGTFYGEQARERMAHSIRLIQEIKNCLEYDNVKIELTKAKDFRRVACFRLKELNKAAENYKKNRENPMEDWRDFFWDFLCTELNPLIKSYNKFIIPKIDKWTADTSKESISNYTQTLSKENFQFNYLFNILMTFSEDIFNFPSAKLRRLDKIRLENISKVKGLRTSGYLIIELQSINYAMEKLFASIESLSCAICPKKKKAYHSFMIRLHMSFFAHDQALNSTPKFQEKNLYYFLMNKNPDIALVKKEEDTAWIKNAEQALTQEAHKYNHNLIRLNKIIGTLNDTTAKPTEKIHALSSYHFFCSRHVVGLTIGIVGAICMIVLAILYTSNQGDIADEYEEDTEGYWKYEECWEYNE